MMVFSVYGKNRNDGDTMGLEVAMQNLKKSHDIRIAVSDSDWYKFQLLAHEEKSTPRLALAWLVHDCLKRDAIFISPKRKKSGTLQKP